MDTDTTEDHGALKPTTIRVPPDLAERIRVAWKSDPAQMSHGKIVTRALAEQLPQLEADVQRRTEKKRLRRPAIFMPNGRSTLSIRVPEELRRRASFVYRNNADFASVAHVMATCIHYHLLTDDTPAVPEPADAAA